MHICLHDYDPRVRYTCYFETASVNLFLAQNGVLNRYSFRNSYWYPFTVGSGPPTNSLGRQSSREQDRNRSSTQSAAVSRRLAVRKLSSFRYIPQPDTLWICWLAHGAWCHQMVTYYSFRSRSLQVRSIFAGIKCSNTLYHQL